MAGAIEDQVEAVLASLPRQADPKVLADMGPRYGLVVDKAMGVPMNRMQAVAKAAGRDHALAEALWEARNASLPFQRTVRSVDPASRSAVARAAARRAGFFFPPAKADAKGRAA